VEPDFVARELQDRLMLTLVNESVACLRLGVVADADLVDAGVIFGAGFAPFRGGPLHWARETGPETLKMRLQQLALQHGSRFEPDPGWSLL
jgi:3-hydroxyacyl-CoA dehydrogenase/enoyl-CoA hydratase/3-hydroxybutyryl-CoA epimerase